MESAYIPLDRPKVVMNNYNFFKKSPITGENMYKNINFRPVSGTFSVLSRFLSYT